MKRICSWCNKEMGSGTEVLSGPDHIVTHGICETCAADVLADIEEFDLRMPNPFSRDFALVDTFSGTDPGLSAAALARVIKLPR
jgi:hypothetical protein